MPNPRARRRPVRRIAVVTVTVAAVVAVLLANPAGAQIQVCPIALDPTPSGVWSTPNATFPGADHYYLHSSTHLQGRRAHEKWTGGLLYRPPAASGFDQFTSAVVVDNPDPAQAMTVRIDYFDHNGALVGTSFPPVIQPEGFHVEAATPLAGSFGVGAARVTVLSGPGLVGGVLLHTPCITTSWQGTICDTDIPQPTPGASSLQQLQDVQDNQTELWWGPLPLTLNSRIDFFNAQAPFLWVVNPHDSPNTIRVDLVAYDRLTGVSTPFTWRTVTLPPFGTLLEKSGPHLAGPPVAGLWDQFFTWYSTLVQPYDYDILVHVESESGLPILGDGVMTDIYGDSLGSDGVVQAAGKRFRMASHMLANNPSWRLIDPDFSYEPSGIVHTLIGVANVGPAATGQAVRINYYRRNGTLASTGNLGVLQPNTSVRIVPGTFGYPANMMDFGWARIDGCATADKLIGWTVREILPTGSPHYHKAFGEILDGINGPEPGNGFQVTNATGTWVRKVSPLVRTWPSWYWPGYTTFANTGTANVGNHWFRFFSGAGGVCTNPAGQPFGGVPFAATSTTYEDPQSVCGPANLSGRVDVQQGPFKGINVLGDPFVEYGIPGFADGNF